MSVTIVCTVTRTVAIVIETSGFRPYGTMIIRLYVSITPIPCQGILVLMT